jgi:dihydrofolate reductase
MASLDGFIETPNRELDWVIVDEELHQYINDQQSSVDTHIYGRRMYELMAKDWPPAGDDPSAPGYIVEFARIWKSMPKIVFSKTLERVDWNSRLVRDDAAKEIARLKAQPGKNLSVGGANLAATLMRQGLIDEYQIFVHPVILGAGTPMFPSLSDRINLRLVDSRTFGTGVVMLVYQRGESAGSSGAE